MTIQELFENYGCLNHRVEIYFLNATMPSYFGRIDKIPIRFETEEVNMFFMDDDSENVHLIVEMKKSPLNYFKE